MTKSQRKKRPTNRRGGIHYSWVMLGVAFIGLIVAAAVRSQPGIILKSLEQELGIIVLPVLYVFMRDAGRA